jgi:RND family efflux transporter MFP subunit
VTEVRQISPPDVELLRIPRKEKRGAPRRRRRGFGWLVVLVLLLGAGYLAWPRVAPLVARWRAPAVRTAAVVKTRPGASAELTTASGYVVARTKAAVSSKLSGRLVDLRVDVGSRVSKGDVLGRIEDDVYRAAFDQAGAEVAQGKAEEVAAAVRVTIAEKAAARARAALGEKQAEIDQWTVEMAEAVRVVAREEELLRREAGTPEAVAQARYRRDLMQANVERAKSQLRTSETAALEAEAEIPGQRARIAVAREATRRAEALLATARSNLADTELKAPFDGVVLRKEADVGEMVVPALLGGGSTRGAVVTLADFSTLEMEVDVFERDLHFIRDVGPTRIFLDAYPEEPMEGRVRQIEPTADRVKATVLVKVTFGRLDPRVLPEMGGRVVFLRPGTETVPAPEILAPLGAVVTRDGKQGVFVVEGQTVRFVAVAVLAERRTGSAVNSGLLGGELVVVDPPASLANGMTVRTE